MSSSYRSAFSSTNLVISERIGWSQNVLSVQETQGHANPPASSTVTKVGGTRGNNAFFRPLLGYVMTSNEHEMLTKFLNLKHPVSLVLEN